MSDLQEQVNKTYREEVAKIVADKSTNSSLYEAILSRYGLYIGYPSTRKDWEKQPYLEDKQCEQWLFQKETHSSEKTGEDILIMQGYSSEGFECLMKAAPQILYCEPEKCLQRLAREDVMDKVLDIYGMTLGQPEDVRKELRKQVRRPINSGFSNQPLGRVQPQNSQQFVTFLPAHDLSSILVEDYSPKIYAVPVELEQSERDLFNENQPSRRNYAVPVELNDNERDKYHAFTKTNISDAEILQNWTNDLGCPETVLINVSEREFKICSASLVKLLPLNNQDGTVGPPSVDAKIVNDFDGLPYIVHIVPPTNDSKIL
jgi:hypothetical protein